MSYEHCEKHDCEATNGCDLCSLEKLHYHLCSDHKFCGGNGASLCIESCVPKRSRFPFTPKRCEMCRFGRRLEKELGRYLVPKWM